MLLFDVIFILSWWCILGFSMYKDRSRYRNTIFLSLAVLMTAFALMATLAEAGGEMAELVIAGILGLAVLFVPVLLIVNGVQMRKREGKSLAHMLSLLLGILVLAGEICLAAAMILPYFVNGMFMGKTFAWAPFILMFIAATVAYGSVIFTSFAAYTAFLQVIPRKHDFDYVIINGSGQLIVCKAGEGYR
jgi:hypothetical protein